MPSISVRGTSKILFLLCAAGFATEARAQGDGAMQEELAAAADRIRGGEYDVAESRLSDLIGVSEPVSANVPARVLRLRVRMAACEWKAAQSDADEIAAADPKNAVALIAQAQLLARRGKYEEAAARIQGAFDSPLNITARSLAATWLVEQDRNDEAVAAAKAAIPSVDPEKLSRRETLSLGAVYELLGDVQSASECYVRVAPKEDAKKKLPELSGEDLLDPMLPFDAMTALGDLYFTVYGETQGRPGSERQYRDVLDKNPRHVGANLGRNRSGMVNWILSAEKTEACARSVLELDPDNAEIWTRRAVRWMEDRRFDDAENAARRVLTTNSRDLRAKAVLTTLDLLNGRKKEFDQAAAADRAEKRNQGRLPRMIGKTLKGLYRFSDAIPYLEEAAARNARDAEALTALGECLANTGRETEALQKLKAAEDAEPGYSKPWRTNMIMALSVLEDQYVEAKSANFRFKMHPDEEPLLRDTLVPFYEATRRDYGERYGYMPGGPVQVKVFSRFDDFSTRTTGFTGFGALGVCFGELITSVSPTAAPFRGNFSYLDTAWHEYSHVVHLGISKHRVPRWFTEGLATLEEVKRNPAFDRHMELDLLEARHTDSIFPILEINSAFRGPRILFGYYQGGLICEMLEKRTSTAKFVEALTLFGEDAPLDAVLKKAFGMTGAQIDKEFLQFVDAKLAEVKVRPRLDSPTVNKLRVRVAKQKDDVESLRALAWALVKNENALGADSVLSQLRKCSPDDADGSLVRAELELMRGRPDLAVADYKKGFDGGAEEFFSRLHYASLLIKGEDFAGTKKQLEAAMRAFPKFADEASSPAVMLAALYESEGNIPESTRLLEEYCKVSGAARLSRIVLAKRYEDAGDSAALDRVLGEMLEVEPFDRRTLQRRAAVLIQLKHYEEAAACARRSTLVKFSIDRRPSPAMESMGLSVIMQRARGTPPKRPAGPQQPPAAESAEAVDAKETAEGYALEAEALLELGRTDDARKSWTKAKAADPSNARMLQLEPRLRTESGR